MKIKLASDFRDYYDHMFDLEGVEWRRNSRDNISRKEAHSRLRTCGLTVPLSGRVRELSSLSLPGTIVVVYLDEYAHRSGGKIKLQYAEALRDYPDTYCSFCIPPRMDVRYHHRESKYRTMSMRYLRIGSSVYWLKYQSTDAWRSNFGEVNISDVDAPPCTLQEFRDSEPYPLLAIDFVQSGYGAWYAIDYNTSPGIGGTPVEDRVGPREVYEEVRSWMDTNLDAYREEVDNDTII